MLIEDVDVRHRDEVKQSSCSGIRRPNVHSPPRLSIEQPQADQ